MTAQRTSEQVMQDLLVSFSKGTSSPNDEKITLADASANLLEGLLEAPPGAYKDFLKTYSFESDDIVDFSMSAALLILLQLGELKDA